MATDDAAKRGVADPRGDTSCGTGASASLLSAQRRVLIGQAFRIEWLTMAWMAIEASVAIAAAVAAGSLMLAAFGLDSLFEMARPAC